MFRLLFLCIYDLISGEQLSSFQVILSEMLEDVQERLVYRTQVGISMIRCFINCDKFGESKFLTILTYFLIPLFFLVTLNI